MIQETMTPRERVEAAIKLEPYDRVPVAPLMDVMFPSRHKGMTVAHGLSHWREGFQAIVDIFEKVGGWDAMILPGYSLALTPSVGSGVTVSLGSGRYRFPGQDSAVAVDSQPQYEERELLTVEDYDEIIKLGWSGFAEKNRERFTPFSPEAIISWTERQTAHYIKEKQTWDTKGIPSLCGAIVESPLMFFSTKRSLISFTMDLHRVPDKVQVAMDIVVDEFIAEAIAATRLTAIPGVMLVLERGGGFYYPLKIFERFEFPYMKKMVEAFAAEGLLTVMHFDQDWTVNLPYLKELPKKMCVCELDSTTDIFKAKELLKDHMCIMGDVPASLTSIGTPEEVEAYCKKLIDVVGKDTGFILSSGCTVPADAKFENFKAMIDTAKNHLPIR
ncbi:MAG: uroporphyrinogen-III decarboxylase [Chloroflexi bacterium]|nr:uroporphyrinogen-III decarboxylase [Chloroflexota bacterium]